MSYFSDESLKLICYVHIFIQVPYKLEEKALKCIFQGIDNKTWILMLWSKLYVSYIIKFDDSKNLEDI